MPLVCIMSSEESLRIQPIPYPVSPVIPVDPVPIRRHRPTDLCPLPVGRDPFIRSERPRRPLPTLILQRQVPSVLLNRALL
jgi:hypothetical protein